MKKIRIEGLEGHARATSAIERVPPDEGKRQQRAVHTRLAGDARPPQWRAAGARRHHDHVVQHGQGAEVVWGGEVSLLVLALALVLVLVLMLVLVLVLVRNWAAEVGGRCRRRLRGVCSGCG